jgi:hypothetical protein
MNTRRKLLVALLGASHIVIGCAATPLRDEKKISADDERLRHKFRGLNGVVLRIDALTQKNFVLMTSDKGVRITGAGSINLRNVGNQTYTDSSSLPIPISIRATWKEDPKNEVVMASGGWRGGTIIGDYTVPVAERIPDELLDYIRKNGGALRIKIRLRDDGIAIGWDVEQRLPKKNWKPEYGPQEYYIDYTKAGGDFLEDGLQNGVYGKGWNKPLIGGPPNMADPANQPKQTK